MKLTASTNGTDAGTIHAEVHSSQKRYLEGTYASRVRFADADAPINYQPSWYTYRNDPWFADNQHSEQRRSIGGWHDQISTYTEQVDWFLFARNQVLSGPRSSAALTTAFASAISGPLADIGGPWCVGCRRGRGCGRAWWVR